jgi:hypothetical protein
VFIRARLGRRDATLECARDGRPDEETLLLRALRSAAVVGAPDEVVDVVATPSRAGVCGTDPGVKPFGPSSFCSFPPSELNGGDGELVSVMNSGFEIARGRRSVIGAPGCWSTGKNWHSFFNRTQLPHLVAVGSSAGRHRILRRRQFPAGTEIPC